MTERPLIPHPLAPPASSALTIMAGVALEGRTVLELHYRLRGDLANLDIPGRAPARRTAKLWEGTCFEAFVAFEPAARYYELNFSPSSEWAAYEFDGYRDGMRPLALERPPSLTVTVTPGELRVTAGVEIPTLAAALWPLRIGLTAVVADRAGGRRYYALRHAGDRPDFHDAATFAVSLDGSSR